MAQALDEIVRRKPGSQADLLVLKGIDPSFIDEHAESLLESQQDG